MRGASARGESVEFTLMAKANMSKSIRVGLLAYGAIGHEHNLAVQATSGLELTAVCDTNPDRIVAAKELAPDVASFSDALVICLLYTSPSPRDVEESRMPSSA